MARAHLFPVVEAEQADLRGQKQWGVLMAGFTRGGMAQSVTGSATLGKPCRGQTSKECLPPGRQYLT